jgi:hypothetical protein
MEKSIKSLYEATEQVHNGFVVIKINSGKFEGIEFSYGKIDIKEDKENDRAVLHYKIDLVKNPNDVTLDEKFDQLTGDIVVDLLEDWLEENENEFEDRVDDITDTDDKRKLLSQGDPISEE